MPRGRPRINRTVEPELLPSEEDQPKQPQKTLVDAKHTITYNAPVPVTIEEDLEQSGELLDFDLEEEDRPRRPKKNEREELRKKLMAQGVTPASPLKLLIQRYIHSDSAESGTQVDKEYCTKYACNEQHVTDQDYMAVAAKWGPGRYWFTLYMNNKIVTQWEARLSAPASPTVQHAIPGDPNSPQVIVQMPQGEAGAVFDPVKVMKEQTLAFKQQLENYKLMRDVFGSAAETSQPTANPAIDPDTAFVQSLLTDNTKLKEKISNGLIGQILGSKAVDDDPSIGAVAMEAIKTGQAEKIVQAALAGLGNILERIFSKGNQNNGQAQMAPAPLPTQAMEEGQVSVLQTQQQGNVSHPQSGSIGHEPTELSQDVQAQTPEQQALQLVIDHCAKDLPVQIAFTRLIAYADMINEQAPQYSIDGYLDLFGKMPVDSALEFVKGLPNGEAVVALEHAKTWTEQLQKLIRESQEGEE